MKLKEFDYSLSKDLIAQRPLKQRDESRLMVMDRSQESITDTKFRDIVSYLRPGDCLVMNNTRVLPVRLYGKRKTGAKVEIFLLNPEEKELKALIRPSKRIKTGESIELDDGSHAVIQGDADVGRIVEFDKPVKDIMKGGHIPLPPYINREDSEEDRETYQTVYSDKEGATASPTAGLHFTRELIDHIKHKGVHIVFVTLHTSYGTFSPVKEPDIEDHVMHREFYEITAEAAGIVNSVKKAGGRVFSVGTTSTRVLETVASEKGIVRAASGQTSLFIYPGYRFKIIDGLITNFHLPESTLLMLVSAFSGKDFLFKGYSKAIEEKYRFFSYGDAMLIL